MAKLSVQIVGDDGLTAALNRAKASADAFGARITSVGESVAAVGERMTKTLTLPIVAVGGASVKMAMDFQSAMELLHTQAGVSQTAVESLSKSVLDMAGSVATTPDTLATGIYHLASQGLRGKQALDALRIAAEGAKVGQANLEDVTNALGAVLVSGIKGSQNYTQAMGQLNATVGAGDMHMQDLADAMGTGLPAKAALFGVSLKDVSAALAVFGDNNIRGAEAGTLLNSTIRLMGAPSGAAAKALKTIGISATQLGDDLRSGGLVKAIEDLKTHMTDLGLSATQQAAVLTHAFGGRQAGGVMVLIDQLERLKTKEKEVADGGNKFASDWAAYTQTAAFKMDQLGASMSAAGISIGDMLLPIVSKLINSLTGLVQQFDGLSDSTKKMILIGAGVAAALGPALTIVGNLVAVVGFLVTPVGAAVAAVALLGGAMAAAMLFPDKLQSGLEHLGLSATTSARIVADLQHAFADLKAAGEAVAQSVQQHWPEIQRVIQNVVQIITGVVNIAEALWREFGGQLTAIAKNAWGLVVATIENTVHIIEGVIETFAGLLHGNWSEAWDGVKKIVSAALDQAVAVIKSQISLFVQAAEAVGKAIADGVVNGVGSLASNLYDKLKRAVGSAISSVKGFFGIHSPSTYTRDQIGKPLADGIVSGSDGLDSSLYAALAKHVKSAADRAAIDADIRAAAQHIGMAAADQVAAGVVAGSPTIAEQIKTALVNAVQQAQQAAQQALQSFQSSFTSLASSVLSQFDQITSRYISPAQKQLDAMQATDQRNQLQANLTTAKGEITSALAAQEAAGTDPAKQQAALSQLQQGYADYTAATRAIQEYDLQLKAAKQTAAYDRERAKQRESLARQLGDLETALSKEPGQWQDMSSKVVKLLKKYDVPMYESGQRFASQFSDGIKSQIGAVEKAAEQMAHAVAKYIPHSPAETGPLSKFSADQVGAKFGMDFATGIASGLYQGAGMAAVASAALGSRVSSPGVGTLGNGPGGGSQVHLTVEGFVGNETQLVNELSNAFVRAGRSGHPLWRNLV